MADLPLPVADADSAPFWDACDRGELIVQWCGRCERHQFYPRSHCHRCHGDGLEWRSVEPAGTVHACTVVHRAPTVAFRERVPYVIALVDLDAGVRMMMNVVRCEPEGVSIGMRVRVVFEERLVDGERRRIPQAAPHSG